MLGSLAINVKVPGYQCWGAWLSMLGSLAINVREPGYQCWGAWLSLLGSLAIKMDSLLRPLFISLSVVCLRGRQFTHNFRCCFIPGVIDEAKLTMPYSSVLLFEFYDNLCF